MTKNKTAKKPTTSAKPKKEIDHSQRDHARRPPSSLKYREKCPGWRRMEGRSKFEVYSGEGTAMHEAVEHGTEDHLDENAMIKAIHDHKVGRMLGEQKDCVARVLKYLAPIEKSAKSVEREVRMPIAPEWGVDFGTVDFLATQKDESIDMADYKFGKHLVDDADENAQFAIGYVLGVFRHRPACKEVRVHILQPRCREEADVATYKREQWKALELRLATIISREEFANVKDFRPSYDACLYCGNKAKCPVLVNFALKVAKKTDAYPPILLDKMPITVEACKDDPEVIAGLKDLAKVMEEWSSEVSGHALQWVVDHAMDLPGFEMKEKNGGRFVTNALLAWNELEDFRMLADGTITKLDKVPKKELKTAKPLMNVREFLTAVSRLDFEAFDKLVAAQVGRGGKGKAVEAVAKLLTAEGVLQRYPGAKYLRRLRKGE